MKEEQAKAIQERPVNEIPAERFLEMPKVIWFYKGNYMGALKPDDPLFVK